VKTCPTKLLDDENGQYVPNPNYTLWIRKDQFLLSWIISTLSEKVLSQVYGLDTSRLIWAALQNKFASQSQSRISHIKRQLQCLRQGSKTCSEYITDAKSLADQLAVIGKPIDDDDLINFVMSGLNPTFNAFITTFTLLLSRDKTSFDDFQNELLSHEMLLNQQQLAAPDTSTFALFSHKPGTPKSGTRQQHFLKPKQQFQRYPSRGPSQPPNGGFFQHNRGTSPQYRGPYQSSNGFSSKPFSNSTQPQQHSASNQPGNKPLLRAPCQICGKISHQALDCYHRMDHAYQGRHPPSQLAAMIAQNTNFDDSEWFADSGANAHITNDLETLSIQQPFEGTETVAVGNGSGLTINNSGSTLVHTSKSVFKLNNVLHCPKASAQLLSIQRFCKDNDCFFILSDSHFLVKDKRTKAILLAGKSENGLYPLRFKRSSLKAQHAAVALIGIRTSHLIWHYRLGHPATDIVSRVVKSSHLPVISSASNEMLVCESCQLGKSKHLPFSASNRRTNTPLHLIHTDIWTSPVISISGYKYYVIFVDDFSRFSWLYPLHTKSDVYDCFVKFKLLAENQFSSSIKQLQSDGGGEFMSHRFQTFLSNNGIAHRKSCPYTSQQNGLAERKLRHILEIGLTLLAHSHLPNRYWLEAFLTAVHLINRLPSPVLDHTSPFFQLYHKEPDYQHLKVFGCKCFPLLRPLGLHKLQFRSKPCIFIGYNFAGYKCLDPITNKVYLSRHVVFDEATFPAKDQSNSPLPSKINASDGMSSALPVSIPMTYAQFPTSSLATNPSHTSQPNDTHTISPSLPHHPIHDTSPNSSSASALPSTLTAPALPTNTTSTVAPSPPSEPHTCHPMTTRSRTNSLKPKAFPDYQFFYTPKYPPKVFPNTLQDTEPSCYTKSSKDPRWQQAMVEELQALQSNGTWTLCPKPPHQHIISNK